jgi:C-terminal processing protease CtpA/Prc
VVSRAQRFFGVIAALLAAISVGCGGGGSGGDTPQPQADVGEATDWVQGQFLPQETFYARCAAPRIGTDPNTGQSRYPDMPGSVIEENNWLRSWSNDSYLWYDEILDQDPALFADPVAYFDELRTTALTSTGNPKDRFHFSLDTEQWVAQSQSGISAGYGMELLILSAVPPREVVVAFTQPDSPATAAAISRGVRIISVDGEDLISGNTQEIVDVINAGLFPSEAGQLHEFDIVDPGSAIPRSVALTSTEVTSAPVQDVSTVTSPQGATVGYLHFSEHIATAEAALADAVSHLSAQNIEDLIIDVRYNGGGFLAIASQLAYMIAGDAQTAGRTFEMLQFNDKYPATNPVTGSALEPLPFLDETIGLSAVPASQALPTLDLRRVFVITSRRTCSASESIINSLRGVGVEVVQIGQRTCGKPYGFYPTDNCGRTWFSIQFRGVNDAGFGDYADGFTPAAGASTSDTELPGCEVADDFDHSLGNAAEARLAAALQYRDTATCPLSAGPAGFSDATPLALPVLDGEPLAIADGASAWRNNRILIQR